MIMTGYADVDRYVQDAQRAAEGMRAARVRIAGLVGRAETSNGRIRVAWAAGTGLDELHIDPRAMRLRSDELASHISGAITDAMTDLRRQLNEVLRDEAGVPADGETVRLDDMRDAFNQRMDALTDRLDRAQRMMQRATLR
jgi:DNA-binding protein YbaB